MASKRPRNFATIIYQESATENWQDILEEQHVQAFISPIHDKDINSDGTEKKAHYHVLIMFDSPKNTDSAKEIFDKIGGVGCEVVNSTRGYARYLCHLDEKNKYKYNVDDVVCLCGADYTDYVKVATDKYKLIAEMITYCRDNNIYSYQILLDYALANNQEWFRLLCDSATGVIREYLKSMLWTRKLQD